ncbi:MAG: phosphatase PAP2 family protein [Bacteroidia bacterium]|nr:phosphatase PAP2 family protein [Bacteroidia bacterium]
MIEALYNFDIELFYFVNHVIRNDFFDMIMPILRGKFTWIPLYILIIYLVIKKYKKSGYLIILFALLTVFFSDLISSQILKPFFERIRPCNIADFADWINLPIGKGSGWSFTSSHAANHFALAIFFSQIFEGFKTKKSILLLFILWASAISFAQVYIGFHFPADVFAGAVIGIIVGLTGSLICMRKIKKRKIDY